MDRLRPTVSAWTKDICDAWAGGTVPHAREFPIFYLYNVTLCIVCHFEHWIGDWLQYQDLYGDTLGLTVQKKKHFDTSSASSSTAATLCHTVASCDGLPRGHLQFWKMSSVQNCQNVQFDECPVELSLKVSRSPESHVKMPKITTKIIITAYDRKCYLYWSP